MLYIIWYNIDRDGGGEIRRCSRLSSGFVKLGIEPDPSHFFGVIMKEHYTEERKTLWDESMGSFVQLENILNIYMRNLSTIEMRDKKYLRAAINMLRNSRMAFDKIGEIE